MIKKIISNIELRWTILYQISILVGGVALIKLLAVTLTTEQYGYYALITSISAFILMMPFTAFMQGISRYISIYDKKNKYNHFYSTIVFAFIFIITIYLFISYLFSGLLTSDWQSIYIYITFFIVSEIFKVLFYTINNANRQRKNVAISSLLEFSIKLGIVYFLAYTYGLDITFVLIALAIANLVSILILGFRGKGKVSFKYLNIKESKIYFYRIWLFSYPLLIWAVFGWLRDMSNRWYLDYFLDKDSVALFAMMSSIALITPVALQGLIGSFIIPILYQKENTRKGYTRKFLKIMLPLVSIVFVVAFVITYFYKDFIIMMIADEKYLEISWMLPWMFLIYCIYVLSMMSTYELFAHKQTKRLILSSIVPGIISLICGYFLIKDYGINGALVNYAITYGSYSLFTFFVVFKYWRDNDNN